MNSSDTILTFVSFLADVRAMFRQVHLFAERSPVLRTVSTKVIPFRVEPSEYADDGLTISIALNAELQKPTTSECKAIGMSLVLRRAGGVWFSEAEIGRTGENIGWDVIDSREARAVSPEEMMSMVPPLVEWMGQRFRDEVSKLPK